MRPARHAAYSFFLRCPALILAGAAILCGDLLPLAAQELWVGPVADIARRRHSTSLPVFSVSSEACGLFESGWETAVALGGQFSLTPAPGGHLGLSGRLALSPSAGLLSVDAPESFAFYEDQSGGGGEVQRAAHEYRMEIKTLELRLGLLLDWNVTDRLRLHVGPSVGYVLDITVNQSDYISDPVYRFDGGAREQKMTRQDLLASQKLLIGSQAALSYTIPLGRSLVFIPEAVLKAEFTPLFQQAGRFALGPGIGFSVMTRLWDGSEEEIPRAEDEVPPPDAPPPGALRASITLRGVDEEGGTLPRTHVRVYETLRRNPATGMWEAEHRPAPPVLAVEPEFASASGIAAWEVTFSYNGQVIGASSSRDDGPPASFNWKIPDRPDADTAGELTATLHVTDSAGAAVSATDSIPLEIERLSRMVDDRGDSAVYTLYPTPKKSAEEMRENTRALREIAAHAGAGKSIEVVRLVEKSLRTLPADSSERAQAEKEAADVAAQLRAILKEEGKDIPVISGLHDAETFGDRELPEGRPLQPDIRITIRRR